MAETTVSTQWGLLRVDVVQRGARWTARLVEPPSDVAGTPAAVGADRDGVLASLQAAVRAADRSGAARVLGRPASSDLCP